MVRRLESLMNKYISIVIFLSIFAGQARAFPFDGKTAMAYIDTLCSEEFAGRKSGDNTAHLAELWAAGKFAEFGLKPATGVGYLQSFPILNNREIKAELELVNGVHGKKKYLQGDDYHLITNSGSGKIKAEVIFAGYGICEPELGRDDYEGVDMQGKIALIYKDIPGDERIWGEMLSRDYKMRIALEHGAKAVIFVTNSSAISGAAIHKDVFNENIPVILASDNIVRDIFRGTGKSYDRVKDELKGRVISFPTGKILKIDVQLKYNPDARAANVLGILPGSDPLLKDEWVIVGGHLDHNGVNAAGDVFYGADDNASGAAVVMEMARNFAQMNPAPKRSMLFMLFAGEEQGLLGSEYYVNNPIIPLEKAAGMFNFDCCGVGDGKAGLGGKEHFPEIWDAYRVQLPDSVFSQYVLSTTWGAGSDNHHFEQWGVPAFNGWSSGPRPFYHQIEDLPKSLSYDAVTNTGRLDGDFIAFFANWDKAILNEHYRARTILFSAEMISLKPEEKPEDSLAFCARIKELRSMGLKGAPVFIDGDEPYDSFDYWNKLCKENDMRFITNGNELNGCVRAEKMALIPALGDINFFRSAGTELRNLQKMGVRIIFIDDASLDSAKAAELLPLAADLGMAFVYHAGYRYGNLIPEKAKRIILHRGAGELPVIGKETAKSARIAISPSLEELPADIVSNNRNYFIVPNWESPDEIEAAYRTIEKLESMGIERDDIKYMLGKNLIEVISW